MKTIIVICSLAFFSQVTFAYGVYGGTVKDVRVDRGGWGIVAFDGPVSGGYAQCRNENYASHMSFNVNTEGGKAIYAIALAAAASGKQVSAIGTGDCSEYVGIVESLSYLHFIR